MSQCPQCGSQNPDSAKFCSQCGARLAEAAPAGAAGSAEPSANESTATMNLGGQLAAAKPEADDRGTLNESDAAAVRALAPGRALLVVLRGPGAGSRYLLDTDVVTAGRHPEADIFLDDITVSRRHVEFRRTDDGYSVHDVGSLNGTYLNHDRIDDAALNNGDEVRIGKFRLNYFDNRASVK